MYNTIIQALLCVKNLNHVNIYLVHPIVTNDFDTFIVVDVFAFIVVYTDQLVCMFA